MRCLIVVAVLALPAHARADSGLHAGLNLRADPGAHPFRVTGGIDTGPLDVSVTLDPMVVFDDQFDADLLTSTRLSDGGWGLVAGWRSTAIGIQGGRQLQEKLVLGIGAPLPGLGGLPIRTRWTFEAATVIVKHGAGLPTDWISFAQGRDFIDLINFGMFITIEYAGAAR